MPAGQRIVSLVPSQTELLWALGLETEVVGITKFCVRPGHWRSLKTVVGGTKNLHVDRIKALNPTLVIANKEENLREHIEEISRFCPVLVTDVKTISQAQSSLLEIGLATGKAADAEALSQQIGRELALIEPRLPAIKVIYLVWQNPWMAAGSDTYISSALALGGFENAAGYLDGRYPKLTDELLETLEFDALLLSSEPFPFSEKHRADLQKQFADKAVVLADGEILSWYGPRMLALPSEIQRIHYAIEHKKSAPDKG